VSRLPVYPLLIALLAVLDAAVSAGEPLAAMVRPILVVLALALLVFGVSLAVARERHRAAFVTAFALALLLWLPVLAIALGLVIIIPASQALLRRRPLPAVPWPGISRVANVIAIVAAVLAVGTAAFGGLLAPTPGITAARVDTAPRAEPDIYVIVLDGHPRWDTVDALGGDGGAFVAALEGEGLEVARASRSLYNMSALSLASMVDMRTVQDAAAARGVGGTDSRAHARLMSDVISSGAALDRLHAAGYEVVAIPSESTSTAVLGADRLLDGGQLNELETTILSGSLLRWVLPGPVRSFVGQQRRDRLDTALRDVVALAAERSPHPRFVLAHLALPHLPPTIDNAGGPVDGWPCFPQACDADTLGWNQPLDARRTAELANVAAIDARVVEAVRAIRAASASEPVIVLMSDHGARLDPADHEEMFRSLFAASTPGHAGLFGDDVVVGNLMQGLLGAYAGDVHPSVPETSYWLDIGAVRGHGMLDLTPITVDPGAPSASAEP
jgi:hypothetical protein